MSKARRKYSGSNYLRYYSNTSEAYDLNDIRQYNYEYPQNNPVQKQQKQTRIKKATVRRFSILRFYVCTFVMFIGCIMSLASSAAVSVKHNKINKLQNGLKNVKEENLQLAEKLSSKFNMEEIKKTATTKLGMHKPMSHQVVHVKIPKQSYIVKYVNDDKSDEEHLTFAKLLSFFGVTADAS